jgi:hypothetical protein
MFMDRQVEASGFTTLHNTSTPKCRIRLLQLRILSLVINHNSSIGIMADSEEENYHNNGPISPNVVSRLRTTTQSTSVLISVLLTICPALLIGPLLTLLGFGGLGPAAGKHLQYFPSF